MGSYLVTPRGGFVYHGSHMGRGNFVQHRSVVRQFCGGAVEELSLASQLGTRSLGSKPTRALGRPTSVLRLPPTPARNAWPAISDCRPFFVVPILDLS